MKFNLKESKGKGIVWELVRVGQSKGGDKIQILLETDKEGEQLLPFCVWDDVLDFEPRFETSCGNIVAGFRTSNEQRDSVVFDDLSERGITNCCFCGRPIYPCT